MIERFILSREAESVPKREEGDRREDLDALAAVLAADPLGGPAATAVDFKRASLELVGLCSVGALGWLGWLRFRRVPRPAGSPAAGEAAPADPRRSPRGPPSR